MSDATYVYSNVIMRRLDKVKKNGFPDDHLENSQLLIVYDQQHCISIKNSAGLKWEVVGSGRWWLLWASSGTILRNIWKKGRAEINETNIYNVVVCWGEVHSFPNND